MRHRIRAIHFIGIGGAGMAGLAEVMARMGYAVSGSDCREQASLARLRARGVVVHIGHDAAHLAQADCAVYSSAIDADNVERRAALARGIPAIPRAQMLGELMRFKPGIAVAGTHGKTSVSSMVAHVLTRAGLSPTCVIGGRLLSLAEGELIGSGEHVVVEADESDASFLHLQPVIAVVTNIDDDHLEAFGGAFSQLTAAFANFLANLPFYGSAIICCDDPAAAQLAQEIETHRVVRYGLAAQADLRAQDLCAHPDGMSYTLVAGGECTAMRVRALGQHNVQNALAATAVALELGVPLEEIGEGLASFAGVGRRLEFYGEVRINGSSVLLVDDYAHHPSEIAATLAALAAALPQRRIVVVFQPHRYSRTQRLAAQLGQALSAAQCVITLPVYAAGESAPAQDVSAALHAAIDAQCIPCAQREEVYAVLAQTVAEGDVLVCMGAGDVGALPAEIQAQTQQVSDGV